MSRRQKKILVALFDAAVYYTNYGSLSEGKTELLLPQT
jgi:hypothetical protein